MKETGILFTPENIRLVMDDLKGQTRRIINPQPWKNSVNQWLWEYKRGRNLAFWPEIDHYWPLPSQCPYGKVGDRLYIKEGVITHCSIPQLIGYYLDGCRVTEHWMSRRTAMFMPKSMARTWLEITEVRVERLQDISEEDAIAEGVESPDIFREDHDWKICPQCGGTRLYTYHSMSGAQPDSDCTKCDTNAKRYRYLWDSINGKKYPFESNPWVWVIGFKKIK